MTLDEKSGMKELDGWIEQVFHLVIHTVPTYRIILSNILPLGWGFAKVVVLHRYLGTVPGTYRYRTCLQVCIVPVPYCVRFQSNSRYGHAYCI